MISGISNYDSSMLQRMQALSSNTINGTKDKALKATSFIDRLIALMGKDFGSIDTDKSNTIDMGELAAYLTKILSKSQAGQSTRKTDQSQYIAQLVNAIFAQLDPENMGTISKEKLTKTLLGIVDKHAANQTQSTGQFTGQIFSAMDTNKDGTVAAHESLAATGGQSATNTDLNSILTFLENAL